MAIERARATKGLRPRPAGSSAWRMIHASTPCTQATTSGTTLDGRIGNLLEKLRPGVPGKGKNKLVEQECKSHERASERPQALGTRAERGRSGAMQGGNAGRHGRGSGESEVRQVSTLYMYPGHPSRSQQPAASSQQPNTTLSAARTRCSRTCVDSWLRYSADGASRSGRPCCKIRSGIRVY